ncbi:hypothetical protein L291_3969 [Acinetobacter guillouiae MSP4-18]|uniref:hypothetical protein n=1 Tax=Acinetobacter guillouiae TaxID=106649 RepID=UPI0002CE54D8|nr:hypothetical protein [Acinetobacter guillouiae]ENU57353.1 hypothetical protein F981_03581 [Acinetobacter guillouiae CIP 63.46]EPH30810.1 hypothetical protein L291_3969 [Acinetobacter guillouiae MSP4-18]KAB0624923.1 hypothetical protein F7P82_17000 [Acinetobacter guillouiae]
MDRDAINLAYRWQKQFLKGWFKDQWYDALDYLEASIKFFLILLRIIFSPILIIYVAWQFKGIYKQIASGEANREKVRNKIEQAEV